MKKTFFVCALVIGAAFSLAAAPQSQKIGTVSFKKCLEQSKFGKQEQARFEQMKKQLEMQLEQKEKELNELAPKFNEEYLDSLTPEAEAELKEKFRVLSQTFTEQQNQYYQTLNQANMQIMQKMFEMIGDASKVIGKEKNLDLVLNDEVCFFKNDDYDVSDQIVGQLDKQLEKAG